MNVAYLCLGGNIGNRETSIQLAISEISERVGALTAASSIYQTEAWGVSNQQPYLNVCVEVKTALSSTELIDVLLDIEKQLGRERPDNEEYASRTIDIDILFYNQDNVDTPKLSIPHPRLHLRKFVLIPLCDIIPNFLHPVLNKSIFSLLNDCDDKLEVTLYK
jgi:2-amino-4-hydroxy-6-hydroxymethyldihydropteridine diphosphokinase